MRARIRLGLDGPEGEPFDVPERALLGEFAPRAAPARDDGPLLARAVDAPEDGRTLEALAAGARRVLVAVDDATRATPAQRILPLVARHLEAAGVPDERVTLAVARGTHRAVTPDELEGKAGLHARRWRVVQHEWLAPTELVDLGTTPGGMPVVVNRLLPEADLAVGVGQVGVHGIYGASGGAKIAFPGLAGPASVAWTHWTASGRPFEDLLGVVDNPIRREAEEAALRAGLGAVVNVALDAHGRVAWAAGGHPVAAQRACAGRALALAAARLPARPDVVVVDATPAVLDYWQSVKGLYAGAVAVAEGGTIVLVAPNPEGVAERHPELLDLAALPSEEIRARVEEGRVQDVVAAAVARFTARARERADVVLVSSGVDAGSAARLGFAKAATVQEALDGALARAGRGASVAVLRRGGALLPVVPGRNERALAPLLAEAPP